ncbi:putative methyltransferase-domain-containing protein [Cercophora scortea]|uniref:25S rRNA adenine-N(1) methyltransferase n=1 Tax=Cercophora scortea TaxID=314031 RepID=A0AAE0MIB0_9PEZI|nr:putative methyltransferase-domain-containing protein [Cercophora scortea]
MAAKKTTRQPKSLAAGRPPTLNRTRSISRKTTKALIGKHHVLEKRKQQAIAKGDKSAVSVIDAEIAAMGGIQKYQEASLQGQRHDRGGDSSRVLMQWLEPCLKERKALGEGPLRLLEVGALSTQNACSKSGFFDIQRIDLNSQGEGILQQDFMERPLPQSDADKFDVLSLSLVLNFAPDPKGRGEMLLRTTEFLHEPERYLGSETPMDKFPCLFLVLPQPCVANSRYLDEARLTAIMESMGYTKTKSKTTQRLVYYLWTRESTCLGLGGPFPKKELRTGGTRNNFAIVL